MFKQPVSRCFGNYKIHIYVLFYYLFYNITYRTSVQQYSRGGNLVPIFYCLVQ